jgi:hypothetical protein|tara:strand:+ start:667 stop:1053 length:387 start_codon:yes stop_codon:yes gene_type:complete
MKKLLFLVLTVLIVACSSDDNNSNIQTCGESSIVGTWDNQVLFDNVPIDSWQFNSNETGSYSVLGEVLVEITWEANESVISTNVFIEGIEAPFLDFNYSFSSDCDEINLQADANEDFPDGIDFYYDRR